jgi:hypothetical protein
MFVCWPMVPSVLGLGADSASCTGVLSKRTVRGQRPHICGHNGASEMSPANGVQLTGRPTCEWDALVTCEAFLAFAKCMPIIVTPCSLCQA